MMEFAPLTFMRFFKKIRQNRKIKNTMEAKFLSLQYLETLSSADLIALADDYGIDIPDDLNRRFIIGELLEVAQEIMQDESSEAEEMVEGKIRMSHEEKLPTSFNETQISVILRNPAWAFVYWDISEADIKKIQASDKFKHLILRTSYFDSEESKTPLSSFEVQIQLSEREQYILIEAGKRFMRIDLVLNFADGTTDNLCVSRRIALPEIPEIFKKAFPGQDVDMPEILEVSGMKKLLKSHYEKYRQSFVE